MTRQENERLQVAIDGPAGAGKSSLAKALAQRLGAVYVDTGAIYRAVGLSIARQGGDCRKPEDVLPRLPEIKLTLDFGSDGLQRMYLNGEDVTEAIRDNAVSAYASQVSAIPEVRAFLLEMQRQLAAEQSVVMDGRDIGTVVMPQALDKIFFTPTPEQRALRRWKELRAKGQEADLAVIQAEIIQRDYDDSHRAAAPLRRAEDAVEVDTSALNLEESLEALYAVVKERAGR